MPLSLRRPLATAALALAALPAIASAQGPVSTGGAPVGSIDANWEASVNGGAFGAAFVIPRAFGPAQAIFSTPSGSLPGGAGDNFLTRFAYAFRTTFMGGAVTGFTYMCGVDDLFDAVLLNGAVVAGAGCDRYGASTTFTVTGVQAGLNTLVFTGSGNGITDGLGVSIVSVTTSTVPEPGTWALLATGLVGVAAAARRRAARG